MFKSVNHLEEEIFNINSESKFATLALEIFQFQYNNNPVYKNWVDGLKVKSSTVNSPEKIPFLPIEFFKRYQVVSSPLTERSVTFTSSSTTSLEPAKHYVNNISLYEKSFLNGFELFYGSPSRYCILALLPNYLERSGSSLVYMVNRLIKESGHPLSGFFLNNIGELKKSIDTLKQSRQRVLLIGVSYALLDLAEEVRLDENFIVMETGGMKGRRREMLKEELHATLKKGFGVDQIHSEYGMTELLGQSYSTGDAVFRFPPWMRCFIRDVTDPLSLRKDGKTGGINIIDLANIYSCSFIATQDLGRLNEKNELTLMGRYDNSDVRGCNLMVG